MECLGVSESCRWVTSQSNPMVRSASIIAPTGNLRLPVVEVIVWTLGTNL